jgi:hypothetical protein
MQLALSSCRKERTNRIDARSRMTNVKETQNSGYCDQSGNANIDFIRELHCSLIRVTSVDVAHRRCCWLWSLVCQRYESFTAPISELGPHAGLLFIYPTGVENAAAIVQSKQGTIERFANILTPLRDQIYKIRQDSVSIFYDLSGPLIA